MKRIISVAVLLLSACSVQRQADISDVDTTSGIVRLTYGQAMLQSATTDNDTASGTASRQCQKMGYATAVAYGEPVTTCTVISGSLCLNERVTIQFQCRGMSIDTISTLNHG